MLLSKGIVLACGAALGGLLALAQGYGAKPSSGSKALVASGVGARLKARVARAPSLAVAGAFDCAGGAQMALAFEPVADSVERRNGVDQLTYHLDFTSKASESVDLTYSWTLSDDAGKAIATGRASSPERLEKDGALTSRSLRTPEGLADGFYRVSFVVAGLGDSQHIAYHFDWFLEMAKGRLSEIEGSDWHRRSRATIGRRTEEGEP